MPDRGKPPHPDLPHAARGDAEEGPPPASHPTSHPHPAPAPRRAAAAGELLFLSAVLLSTLWAAVLLFVVYPASPAAPVPADDEVPVMSLQGSVVTVKRAALEEALASGRYLAASQEQVDYFNAQRAARLEAVERDRLFWYAAAAAFPGAALLLFRVWYRTRRRG